MPASWGNLAVQGLIDFGQIKSGQKVLANGGGSTGTLAIQLAKLFDVEVTGVDRLEKLFRKYNMHMVGYKANKDLEYLVELFETGKLKPVIDKCYSFEKTAHAFRYFGQGRFKGKVVVTFESMSLN